MRESRGVQHIKKLQEHGGKWAEAGSVRWAFEPAQGEGGEPGRWRTKFPQNISEADGVRLKKLVSALEGLDDVEQIYTNRTR